MEASVRRQVFGVDFSAARDAGSKIWIARGTAHGGALQIDACHPAEDLPGSSRQRDRALTALCDFIARQRDAAFGLDFPFGLPRGLVHEQTWDDFIRAFPSRYRGAAAFREACREAADGRELKRATDVGSRTPFSPYNLRLFRQTFHGICNIIHPLVRDDLARVVPMQTPARHKPWIFEVCPASTLKAYELYMPYKGATDQHRSARRQILQAIEELGPVEFTDAALASKLWDDSGGDALDSVIAALAVFRALDSEAPAESGADPRYMLEGYVYE